ncbi:hypothetical protein V2A60_009640 [Cordyceps javanica]
MLENIAPYQTRGLPPMPAVSRRTIPMAGLLVDVYGLDELPAGATGAGADGTAPALPTTCLWLLHPRTRDRGQMADIASRAVAGWHADERASRSRGLVALAFDMPNHGTRLVSAAANEAWDAGNETHAVDMLGMVKGAVADMAGLMDLTDGYLGVRVDAHACLGWSLGGHSAWQAWMGEDRIDAAVVIVGCPDFMNLMSTRAAASNMITTTGSGSASFIGGRHFPPSLVRVCAAHDPKGLLFGTDDAAVPGLPLRDADRDRVRRALDRHRLAGKRLLLCSGGRDKLVPPAVGQPVVDVLTDASGGGGWYAGGMSVDSRVYDDVGHAFSKDMVTDAVAFLVDAVARGPRERESGRARI